MEQALQADLLQTKFHFPRVRRRIVRRPRLVERLQRGLEGPLTLISAPAGYGKTTLLSEWRAGRASDFPVAWLSLDPGDDEPQRFMRYLVSALDLLRPGTLGDVSELLQASQLPPDDLLLTLLINGLDVFDQDFFLVLNDLHAVTDPTIHQRLAFLLDHLPLQMHLVILTRADPPLPLARLRVSGQLVELRQRDLRFTSEEATIFLHDVMGLELTEGDIQGLMARTEGWIAGLQLAALSIQGQEDPSQVIATFGGGYQYIVDYLIQEVLDRQPDPVRRFLLQTSILDSLSGPLCDAVTGETIGAATLEWMERANLFVSELGGDCCWYRYHHLFADVTRNLLRRHYSGQLPELHRRAATWYRNNHFFPEAIKHALASEDWNYAAELVADFSQVAWRSGEITRILEWVRELPEELQCTYPRLSIGYGWACVLTGQYEACEAACAEIEPAIKDSPELQVDWYTVQVFLARARGQQERAVELAQLARSLPDVGSVETQALLMLSLGIALWDLGRVRESAAAAEEATRLAEKAGNWHAWAVMQGFLGLAQASFGNLHLAKEIYERVTHTTLEVPRWVGGGFAQVCLSALYYEWDDLDQAMEYALTGLEYSQITGHSEIQLNCYRQLAFIYQAQQKPEKARQILQEAEQVVHKHYLPRLWGPEHVQIALAQRDMTRALHWIGEVHGQYGAAIHYPAIPLEPAKVALLAGDKATAADLLAERYSQAARDGITYAQIEIRVLQALASDEEEQAMAYLCDALAWAQPEGFCRIFVDQGNALEPLLRQAAQMGFYPSYVVELLSAIEETSKSPAPVIQPLLEPLSERELQVLQLVAAGKSNQEIAEALVIALGTVKRHIYNIYGKLNVGSRTQCTARAQELRLLK